MEDFCSESNKVLSEVHLHGSSSLSASQLTDVTREEYYLTRFVFKIPSFSRSEDDLYGFDTASSAVLLHQNKLEESQIKTDSDSESENNSDKCDVRVELSIEKSIIPTFEDADGDMVLTRKKHCNFFEQGDKETSLSADRTREYANGMMNSHANLHSTNIADQKIVEQTSDPSIELGSSSNTSPTEILTIEHKMSTDISEVGFQVWCGALLMCDYLLYREKDFQGLRVLDLGSGTGITSIVAAMLGSNVVCTDILKVAERNWIRNKECLPGCETSNVQFCLLDWTQDFPPSPGHLGTNESPDVLSFLGQNCEEPQLLIAAEVIYDVELTDAFFRTVYHILSTPPEKLLLITLEKRIVFSSESHSVCSPAYEQFRENVEDLASVDEGRVRFSVEQIPTNFPKYFDYSRLKELELWKISSQFPV